MGKATGFLEYKRKELGHRLVAERIKDYEEFALPSKEEDLEEQAARCMDCGVPFCNTGELVDGLAMGCPLGNLIPEINDLAYTKHVEEAYARLSKTNPFPEFTGRVCPAPCEGSCTLGRHEPAVSIKQIEFYTVMHLYDAGKIVPKKPKLRSGKKVAVVGAGPAGLACAWQLNRLGHEVTVFERADRAGGLLMYGIPNMKLDKKLVLRRIKLLEEEGIRFQMDTEIGVDIPASKIVNEFDATILCCGASKARMLQVPGAELKGVCAAVDFLSQNTKSLLDSNLQDGNYLSAKGLDVIIIGGGDTGTDCVATSIRHGAKSVTQIEIMPEAPIERAENNPWPQWPKTLKVDYGQEEAIELFGKDPREYLTTVKEVIADESGKVKAVKTVKVDWYRDASGRMVSREVPGSEQIRSAGLVLIAMGFLGPEQELIEQLNLETDARSNVAASFGEYSSSVPGIFAAGDMRRGQSLVVWALTEGRDAAKRCHRFLMEENEKV